MPISGLLLPRSESPDAEMSELDHKFVLTIPQNLQNSSAILLMNFVSLKYLFFHTFADSNGNSNFVEVSTLLPRLFRIDCVRLWNYSLLTIEENIIKKRASEIAVQVFGKTTNRNPGGSGFIAKRLPSDNIKKGKYKYLVLTNDHVIRSIGSNFTIITNDSKHYSSQPQSSSTSSILDIGLLYFYSDIDYPIATINTKEIPQYPQNIYILGFPCNNNNCGKAKFTIGKVGPSKTLIGNNSLKSGYSLPYNNETQVGMSGSPVLNLHSEVIGIHGKAKYGSNPLFANNDEPAAYIFEDRSSPTSEVSSVIPYFSWGIPASKFDSILSNNSSGNTGKLDTKSKDNSGKQGESIFLNLELITSIILGAITVLAIGLVFREFIWKNRYLWQKKDMLFLSKKEQQKDEKQPLADFVLQNEYFNNSSELIATIKELKISIDRMNHQMVETSSINRNMLKIIEKLYADLSKGKSN
jgi:S1-C subfamily serine protease